MARAQGTQDERRRAGLPRAGICEHPFIYGMCRAIKLLALVLVTGAAAPAAASAWSNTLPANGTLSANQAIVSPDNHYVLLMQSDGNLVEYLYGGRAVWNSGTAGDSGVHAVMQQNGNLVLYDPANAAVWSSNSRATGCPQLVIQNDGNVVAYGPGAIWSTNTVQNLLLPNDVLYPGWGIYSAHEEFHLLMQGDGNLVLYDANGHALWNSRTAGHPGAHAIMQPDGNLVVYDPSGHALWASNTAGRSGAHAFMQDDGNFVIYQGAKAVWSTVTYGKGAGGSQAPGPPPPASCPPPPPPPPPKPAAAPTAPVVSVPVTTVVHPRARRHLKVKLVLTWTWNRATTWLGEVKVGRSPGRTRLAMDCRGRGCPAYRKARTAGLRSLHRALRGLEGQRYRAGDRLFITLSAPGYLPERAEISFRNGRVPRIRLLRR